MPPTQTPQSKTRLSDIEKGMILAYKAEGYPRSAIAEKLQRSENTIQSFLTRYKTRVTTENLPTGHRPRKTTERADRALVRAALNGAEGRRQPLGELTNLNTPDLCTRTVKRRLSENDIQKWRAAKRPLLEQDHAKQRLLWAKEKKYWTGHDWQRVMFSDECSVERSADPRAVWVFRRRWERFHKDCVDPRRKSGAVTVGIHSCFAGEIPGWLHMVDGYMNQHKYVEILREELPTFAQEVRKSLAKEPIFQQDNARYHTTPLVKDCFKKLQVKVMEFPPYSPDLNPIEQVWVMLKARLHTLYPDINSWKGSPETVQKRMREAIKEAFHTLDASLFWDLCWSMPARCQAVIQAKGWYTKY